MSNRAYIQQETKIVFHNGRISKRVSVCNDFHYQFINLPQERDFFTDNVDLFKFILDSIVDSLYYEEIDEIFQVVIEYKTGIYIENNWFTWEQIEPIFKEFNMLEDQG